MRPRPERTWGSANVSVENGVARRGLSACLLSEKPALPHPVRWYFRTSTRGKQQLGCQRPNQSANRRIWLSCKDFRVPGECGKLVPRRCFSPTCYFFSTFAQNGTPFPLTLPLPFDSIWQSLQELRTEIHRSEEHSGRAADSGRVS